MNDYPFLHSVLSPELWFAKSLPMVIYTEQSISSKLAISVAVCITASIPHTTSPVPQQPNLLLVDTFVTKARFYHFFLHQTQSKRDGNVS